MRVGCGSVGCPWLLAREYVFLTLIKVWARGVMWSVIGVDDECEWGRARKKIVCRWLERVGDDVEVK